LKSPIDTTDIFKNSAQSSCWLRRDDRQTNGETNGHIFVTFRCEYPKNWFSEVYVHYPLGD